MANEAKLNKGTTIALQASGASISDGGFVECSTARLATDDAGYVQGLFEFKTAAGGFTAAPTAGAVINIYERKTVDGSDAPAVGSTYRNDLVASLPVKPSDEEQPLACVASIHLEGAKYVVEWVDGGSGSAGLDSGWSLDLTPCAFGT